MNAPGFHMNLYFYLFLVTMKVSGVLVSAMSKLWCKTEILPLLVSGLTASIALEETGQIRKGETVLGINIRLHSDGFLGSGSCCGY